jgi:hypothetical protein
MADKEPKVVLSKTWGKIILVALVLLDAILDIIFAKGSGAQSGIWKPISNLLGISNPLFLTPIALAIFYLAMKGGAWLAVKVDKVTIKAEELVLSTMVLVYGVFCLWLILFYLFDFRLLKNHYYLIPILIVIGIVYSWWAEKKLKA